MKDNDKKNQNVGNIAQKKECCDCEELKRNIKELVNTVDKVEDDKLVLENQLKKALADYHNLLSNVEKRETLRFFQLKKSLCEEMIPSLDSIMLAVKLSKDVVLDDKGKSWLEGITGTFDNMSKAFGSFGLKQYIPNNGDDFNSDIHEVIAMVDQGEKGKIFDVVQPGYTLDDIVIRQARVVVSK